MSVIPRVCVLRAPGTNCDLETAHAFELCGGSADRVHLFRLLESPTLLEGYQILCIPGGFSYGDDIGAGVIFGGQLAGELGETLGKFLQADKLVLGICNGFQTLLKCGILPGGTESFGKQSRPDAEATLTWNANGKYTARWVHTKVGKTNSVFLSGITELDLPIAHAEGRIVVRHPSTVQNWTARGQSALRYSTWLTTDSGRQVQIDSPRWPANPNGSTDDLAGLSDPTGRILGLMPHPERFLFGTQHPQWTRRGLGRAIGQGRQLFQNGVDYFR